MEASESIQKPYIIRIDRVFPGQPAAHEVTCPLSLLDATTANFALTSAVWLLECPDESFAPTDLPAHLRTTLRATLNAYPQWCGFLKSINALDSNDLDAEISEFPAHARRYGRVYVQYGTNSDPGVEFIEAKSMATVDSLYSVRSANRRPVWNRLEDEVTLAQFVAPTVVVNGIRSNERDANGSYQPSMAIQFTRLACGGLVLSAKIAHPLADITALCHFAQDWARVSRCVIAKEPLPASSAVFDPACLDMCAAGDINAGKANSAIVEDALALPLHRYDWWAPPMKPPSVFPADLPPAGVPLPWAEWNPEAKVEQYTIHLSREQIDVLWRSAVRDSRVALSDMRISKHDALLAHVWSCVVRARGIQEEQEPVYCDLVLGTRPTLKLGAAFIGSPTMMVKVESTALQVATASLGHIAQGVRGSLTTVNNAQQIAAYLHSIAYEESPQRIWQAFLGRRHILVTSWARAGIHNVDFGIGARIRYADGVVPCLDGCILIVDSPPTYSTTCSDIHSGTWTNNGLDITLALPYEDMARFLQDPLLLPKI